MYYGYKHLNDFKQLSLVSPELLVIIVLITLVNLFLNGYAFDILLTPYNVKLNKKEKLLVPLMTNFYNYITPFRGGMAARAVYLKKKYNFKYTDFLGTMMSAYILMFFIISEIKFD